MMFCHRCGAQNPDEAQYCMKCGQAIGGIAGQAPSGGYAAMPGAVYAQPQAGHPVSRPEVPSHIVPAIIITIFSSLCCCNPASFAFGVVAIVYASQVDTMLMKGDKPGAEESSRKAKTWCWIAVIAAVVLTILFIIGCFSFGLFNSFIKHAPMGNTI